MMCSSMHHLLFFVTSRRRQSLMQRSAVARTKRAKPSKNADMAVDITLTRDRDLSSEERSDLEPDSNSNQSFAEPRSRLRRTQILRPTTHETRNPSFGPKRR